MKITEIKGDLFTADPSYALAHCVSRDVKMGAGIAKIFVKRFPVMKSALLFQPRKVCTAALYTLLEPKHEIHVFNLITKDRFWQKPTYLTLKESLEDMKRQILELGITKLAMPRIGSGLDKLEWQRVKTIIESVFSDTDIEILIYYLD